MGGSGTQDRAAWHLELRRRMAKQEDTLSDEYDERWGEIEPTHRLFMELFLSGLPAEGRVLDAACGTGKYFGMVLVSGRHVLGVDHSAGHLARAHEKFPDVPTERVDLQDIPYRAKFDGVMCVDAMEFVPPEEWPQVLVRFRDALREPGWLYLTVERAPDDRVRAVNRALRAEGMPLVDGEVMWDQPDGYYHHYPGMERVRGWLAEAGFAIDEELEGPWNEDPGDRFAYHHVLASRG
jgi:SAM-dependent methyltransferase